MIQTLNGLACSSSYPLCHIAEVVTISPVWYQCDFKNMSKLALLYICLARNRTTERKVDSNKFSKIEIVQGSGPVPHHLFPGGMEYLWLRPLDVEDEVC